MIKIGRHADIDVSRWINGDAPVTDIASHRVVTCRINQKLGDVLHLFTKGHRRLPVTDREGRIRGMLSATDVLRAMADTKKRKTPKMDVRVKSVMSSHLLHIDKNTTVSDAVEFFRKHRKGAYPVMYRGNLMGIVTEWDLVRQVRNRTGAKVSEIMVRKPIVAQENYSVFDVAKMLCVGGFRRLPVVNRGILTGIITPRDILSFLHESGQQERLADQTQSIKRVMERYVSAIGMSADIHESVKIMTGKKLGGLPVTDDGEVLGIITERDIVDCLCFG